MATCCCHGFGKALIDFGTTIGRDVTKQEEGAEIDVEMSSK
jgi:hypothetical protein